MTTPIETFLPPLARSFLRGDHLDLLAPLELIAGDSAGELPPARNDLAAGRERLAAVLESRNRELGHPRARQLASKLADPSTRVVITGQQAGFLGGPLYTVSKAVAAARWAAELEANGEPAVALFWVATEDHDQAEVQRCFVPGTDCRFSSAPVGLELADGPGDLRPVGELVLGPEATRVIDEIAAALSPDHRPELERLCAASLCGARFGSAFGSTLALLLGERCPLLLDAQEPVLKRLERPFLRRLVEDRDACRRGLAAREAEVEARGFSLQVAAAGDWSPLFLLDEEGRRRRIGFRGDDRYLLRGVGGAEGNESEDQDWPVENLLEIVDREPERVSPGALARPAIQDAVLGTSVFVVGPGELSYLAQGAVYHELLDLPPTAIALRPQVLFVDERRRRQIEDLEARGLDLATLLGPEETLEARQAELAGGEPVSEVERVINGQLEKLRASLEAIEPQLSSALDKTRDQIERALDKLRTRAVQSLARRDEVARARVAALRQLCRPAGALQERVVTSAPFCAQWGPGLVDALWRDLDLDPRQLQLITPRVAVPSSSDSEVTDRMATEAGG